jgi:hypothetical protein
MRMYIFGNKKITNMEIFVSIDIAQMKYDLEYTQDEIWSALNKGIKYGLDAKGIAAPLDVKVVDVSDTKNEIEEMKIQELVSSYIKLSDTYKEMWQEAKADAERFIDISFGMPHDVMDEINAVNGYHERLKESGEEFDDVGIKFALKVLHNVLGKLVNRMPTNKVK